MKDKASSQKQSQSKWSICCIIAISSVCVTWILWYVTVSRHPSTAGREDSQDWYEGDEEIELMIDKPVGWHDSKNFTCHDYAERQWCTSEGLLGKSWASNQTFKDFTNENTDAAKACHACNGGQSVKFSTKSTGSCRFPLKSPHLCSDAAVALNIPSHRELTRFDFKDSTPSFCSVRPAISPLYHGQAIVHFMHAAENAGFGARPSGNCTNKMICLCADKLIVDDRLSQEQLMTCDERLTGFLYRTSVWMHRNRRISTLFKILVLLVPFMYPVTWSICKNCWRNLLNSLSGEFGWFTPVVVTFGLFMIFGPLGSLHSSYELIYASFTVAGHHSVRAFSYAVVASGMLLDLFIFARRSSIKLMMTEVWGLSHFTEDREKYKKALRSVTSSLSRSSDSASKTQEIEETEKELEEKEKYKEVLEHLIKVLEGKADLEEVDIEYKEWYESKQWPQGQPTRPSPSDVDYSFLDKVSSDARNKEYMKWFDRKEILRVSKSQYFIDFMNFIRWAMILIYLVLVAVYWYTWNLEKAYVPLFGHCPWWHRFMCQHAGAFAKFIRCVYSVLVLSGPRLAVMIALNTKFCRMHLLLDKLDLCDERQSSYQLAQYGYEDRPLSGSDGYTAMQRDSTITTHDLATPASPSRDGSASPTRSLSFESPTHSAGSPQQLRTPSKADTEQERVDPEKLNRLINEKYNMDCQWALALSLQTGIDSLHSVILSLLFAQELMCPSGMPSSVQFSISTIFLMMQLQPIVVYNVRLERYFAELTSKSWFETGPIENLPDLENESLSVRLYGFFFNKRYFWSLVGGNLLLYMNALINTG